MPYATLFVVQSLLHGPRHWRHVADNVASLCKRSEEAFTEVIEKKEERKRRTLKKEHEEAINELERRVAEEMREGNARLERQLMEPEHRPSPASFKAANNPIELTEERILNLVSREGLSYVEAYELVTGELEEEAAKRRAKEAERGV